MKLELQLAIIEQSKSVDVRGFCEGGRSKTAGWS